MKIETRCVSHYEIENEKWIAGETVHMMKRKQNQRQRIANNIGLFTNKLRANVSRVKIQKYKDKSRYV